MEKIVLVDGLNLLFRMFYGIPRSIKDKDGKEIRGVIGFMGYINKLNKEYSSFSIIVIFDSETSKSANSFIDNTYKKNRTDYSNIPDNDNPFSNLSMIKEKLSELNIFYIEVDFYEADDYIASIIHKYKSYEFIICSNDSDYIQLINNKVRLLVSRGKENILYDKKLVTEKYHIFPSQLIEYKALVGDSSDNIKGISGIGKVTAIKILSFGSIYLFIKKSTNYKLINTLLNNKDIITKNIKLITLNHNINLDLYCNTLVSSFSCMEDK